jgi:hypothetical protein
MERERPKHRSLLKAISMTSLFEMLNEQMTAHNVNEADTQRLADADAVPDGQLELSVAVDSPGSDKKKLW